jgi:two-component system nitrate/nitrite response regulator NarL
VVFTARSIVDELWDPAEGGGRNPADVPAHVAPRPAPPARSTVVFADDHPLFRDGLARALSAHVRLELVGEAAEGVRALELIQELEPDLALLDLKMPGLDGLEVCRAVAAGSPPLRTRVVLLSAYVDPGLVARAMCAGAAGYLSKDASRTEICDALLEVAAGNTAFDPGASAGLADELELLYRLEPPDTTVG